MKKRDFVVENELYTCRINDEETMVTITTELGHEFARRFAEFETGKDSVNISLTFVGEKNGTIYLFRLRYPGCLPGEFQETGEDRYKELAAKRGQHGIGCKHSRKVGPCSLCDAERERLELIALIKAGKL